MERCGARRGIRSFWTGFLVALAVLGAVPAWAACGDPGQDACVCGFLGLGRCCDYDYLPLLGKCSDSAGFPVFCGDTNERACTVFEHVHACKSGRTNVAGICRVLDSDGFPTFCGGEGERACTVLEHIPSCKAGLAEIPFPGGTCTRLDSDGYPTFCGGVDEPPCNAAIQVQLAIRSCKAGLAEIPFPGGPCRQLDAQGYPTFCGDLSEPACDIGLQVQLGITSCKPGLLEVGGVCDGLDGDGFPTRCGDVGEPGCAIDVQLILGKPSCKPSTVAGRQVAEIPPVGGTCVLLDEDGFPPWCGGDQERPCTLVEHVPSCKPDLEEGDGICKDTFPADCGRNGQRACTLAERLSGCKSTLTLRPFDFGECGRDPETWPADEVPRGGPRTVFYIHGRGGDLADLGDASNGDNDLLHRLAFRVPNVKRFYGVDWNNRSDSTPRPLTVRRLLRDESATCDPVPGPAPTCNPDALTCDGDPDTTCDVDADCEKKNCTGGPNPGRACTDAAKHCQTFTADGTFGVEAFDHTDFRIYEIARATSEAIKALPTEGAITIVTTSYGAAIGRHLVYRHYDELRRAGKRIAEVVTVVGPHLGGGMAVPIVPGGELAQNTLACGVVSIQDVTGLEVLGGRSVWHNVCELGQWQDFRKRRHDGILGPPFAPVWMDDRDYPHIRWMAVAENGYRLVVTDDLASHIPDPDTLAPPLDGWARDFLAVNALLNIVDSDGVVPTMSAFGLQMDECYPFTRTPGPLGLPIERTYPFRINTIDPEGDGTTFEVPASSAVCHHPDARPDGRYLEQEELKLNHDVDANVIDFVAAVLSLPGDTNGDGTVDDRDLRATAHAGEDRTLECTGPSTAVTLDGSLSSDPVGQGLIYGWATPQGTVLGESPTVELPVGAHVITLTIVDRIENTSSDDVSITVQDTTPPALDAGDHVRLEATMPSGAPFVVVPRLARDACGEVTLHVEPEPAVFPLGDTRVAVTASDAHGNQAEGALTVTVEDTTPPQVTAPAGVVAEANAVLNTLAIGTATATDIFPVSVASDAPSDGFALGDTVVTWTATDQNGNAATAAQTVTVVDTTAPLLSVPPAVTAEATGVLSALAIGSATATDVFAVTVTSDAPAAFPLGETTVRWTATDSHGHETSATQRVQAVYRFHGFSGPVQPGGVYSANRSLRLRFALSFAGGPLATGATARLQVWSLGAAGAPTDPVEVPFGGSDRFRFKGDHYRLNLRTPGWAPGRYRLTVSLDDGRAYPMEITLR